MFEQFRYLFDMTDEQWLRMVAHFHAINVAPGEFLLKEGQYSEKIFIVETGALRIWFNSFGKEMTTQFFFENKMVSSTLSVENSSVSRINIEAIEPSKVWWIYKSEFEHMIRELMSQPKTINRYVDAIFERSVDYMKHFRSQLSDSPEQRYTKFLHEFPELIQRVPLIYLASFLDMGVEELQIISKKNG